MKKVFNLTIKSLQNDMSDIRAEIEYGGYTEEAGWMCLDLVNRMTGLLCENINDELANYIMDNLDFWYSTTKLVMTVAHADDPDFSTEKYLGF